MLDEAGDLNEMVKILMNKTFFQLDYEFFKKNDKKISDKIDRSMACGATGLIMLVI